MTSKGPFQPKLFYGSMYQDMARPMGDGGNVLGGKSL